MNFKRLVRATSSVPVSAKMTMAYTCRRTLLLRRITEAAASTSIADTTYICGERLHSTKLSTISYGSPDTPEPAESLITWHRDGAVRLRLTESGPAAEKPLSVMTFFRNAVETMPNRAALASKVNGSWSYQTFEQHFENTKRAARGFIKLGLDRYSSVGILGFNSEEWFQSCLGAIFAGGFATGIYTTNSPNACQHVAEHSRCNIIVVENDEQLQKILSVRQQLPHLRAIVQYKGQPSKRLTGVFSWAELMEIGSQSVENELQLRINDQAPNKGCMIVYTSGTTGNSKGAILSHDNLTWTAKRAAERLGYAANADRQYVSYLPLSHVAAQTCDIFVPLSLGATIFFAQPDALKGTLIETLKEVPSTQLLGVPRVFEKMHRAVEATIEQNGFVKKKIVSWARQVGTKAVEARMSGRRPPVASSLADRIVLRKIRHALGLSKTSIFMSAAAPISRSTLNFFASINAPLIEVFGMTELSGPHFFGVANDNVIGSVGREIDGAETVITEPDENGVGELTFSGRNVFMGYLNDEESTLKAFGGPSGIYLKSGDLGRRDSRGCVHISGRIKEIIVTAGGENIPTIEVERKVKEHLPKVLSNVMLIGDGRRYLTMLITLNAETDPKTQSPLIQLTPDVIEWCKANGSSANTTDDVKRDKKLNEVLQRVIDDVNQSATSRAQKIQKWTLLSKDFSIVGGELGPTLKLRRQIVLRKYSDIIESMYCEKPIPVQHIGLSPSSSS